MRKSKVYVFAAIFLLIIVAISGCTDKTGQDGTPGGELKITPAITEAPKVESLPQSIAMNVSAIAVRGGYPASDSKTYQYEIDFFVKNEGNSDIVFDTLGLYFMVDDRGLPLAFLNTGPERKWTVKPGETAIIPTDSANLVSGGVALARSRGYNELVLEAVFYNNGQYVNGVYGALLPLVEDLPHESEGRGSLLKFMLKVPQGAEEEANMAKLYDALPVPNNKMGREVAPVPTKRKIQPSSEITPSPTAGERKRGFDKPTFAMIEFVKYQNYSTMYNGPEYSIDLLIQSATNKPVTFNKIVARYYDQGPLKTIESNLGYPVTLNYGQAVRPTIETAYLQEMQDRVEAAGKKTIVIYIQLKNGEENVGGEYSAALPPVSYMEAKSNNVFQAQLALDNDPLYNRNTH